MSDADKKNKDAISQWQPTNLDNFERLYSRDDPVKKEKGQSFDTLYNRDETGSGDATVTGFKPFFNLSHKAPESTPEANNPKESGSQEEEIDLEQLAQKAYEEGFAKGQNDGLAATQAQAAASIGHLQSLISELEGFWNQFIKQNEKQLLELITKIAEKVVYGQVQIDPTVVKQAIMDALQLTKEPLEVTISVNPEDYEFIDTVKDDFFQQISDLNEVNVVTDPGIHRGGAIIKTQAGQVDATLETRLNAVLQSIISAYDPEST